MSAAVVAVGNELLLGETVDTNRAWLGRNLARLGIPVVAGWTVADDGPAIAGAVAAALEVGDLVVVTGGLGPTPDDRTREAVSALLGRRLHVDAALRDALEARFRARGYERMPPGNLAQASVPEGAVVLGNPVGTAPALALPTDEGAILLLPGVPSELARIFHERAAPYLRSLFDGRLVPVHYRDLHTTGLPESELARRIEQVLASRTGDVDVAFLPQVAGVSLRLSVQGEMDRERAARTLDAVEAALQPIIGPYRFYASGGDLVEAVADALLEAGLTVATGESCTGGLAATRLTDLPGSSAFFLGGAVAYSNEAKTEALGVDAGIIAARGAVSGEVAEALALGAARRFGAVCGLGITGVAGPSGGTPDKPVGTVWYAASVRDRVLARHERFPGDREAVRARAAQASLALLLHMLDGRA